jgi:hypothetical protein
MTVTIIQMFQIPTDPINFRIRSVTGESQSICYKLVINDATKAVAG